MPGVGPPGASDSADGRGVAPVDLVIGGVDVLPPVTVDPPAAGAEVGALLEQAASAAVSRMATARRRRSPRRLPSDGAAVVTVATVYFTGIEIVVVSPVGW